DAATPLTPFFFVDRLRCPSPNGRGAHSRARQPPACCYAAPAGRLSKHLRRNPPEGRGAVAPYSWHGNMRTLLSRFVLASLAVLVAAPAQAADDVAFALNWIIS